MIEVRDEPLEEVKRLFASPRAVPSAIEFVDISGLVAGASSGDGWATVPGPHPGRRRDRSCRREGRTGRTVAAGPPPAAATSTTAPEGCPRRSHAASATSAPRRTPGASPCQTAPGTGCARRSRAVGHAAVERRDTRSSMLLPNVISAWRSSYVFWRFSQSCGVVPKYRAKRRAVSAVIPRCPFRIAVMRFDGTSRALARALADRSISASSSRRISPGCTGLMPFLALIVPPDQW